MMKIYTMQISALTLVLGLLVGASNGVFAGADAGAGSGAASASTGQVSDAAAAASTATSTSVDSVESSAAAAAAASAPGTAAEGISEAEMQGCILGNEQICKTLFEKVMRNLNKILTSSYRMSHSLHVFNPNAVRYSLAKAQMLTKVLMAKK